MLDCRSCLYEEGAPLTDAAGRHRERLLTDEWLGLDEMTTQVDCAMSCYGRCDVCQQRKDVRRDVVGDESEICSKTLETDASIEQSHKQCSTDTAIISDVSPSESQSVHLQKKDDIENKIQPELEIHTEVQITGNVQAAEAVAATAVDATTKHLDIRDIRLEPVIISERDIAEANKDPLVNSPPSIPHESAFRAFFQQHVLPKLQFRNSNSDSENSPSSVSSINFFSLSPQSRRSTPAFQYQPFKFPEDISPPFSSVTSEARPPPFSLDKSKSRSSLSGSVSPPHVQSQSQTTSLNTSTNTFLFFFKIIFL